MEFISVTSILLMFPLEKSGWLQSFLLTYLLITCFSRVIAQCVHFRLFISRYQILVEFG